MKIETEIERAYIIPTRGVSSLGNICHHAISPGILAQFRESSEVIAYHRVSRWLALPSQYVNLIAWGIS
jgi:hypothetical protein